MKTFRDVIKENSILYAIGFDGNISELRISEVKPRKYGYDINVIFNNESNNTFYFFLSNKVLEKQNVELLKVFGVESNEYKNKQNPFYLIGIDKATLIKKYIDKLDESIVYQNDVVNDGLAQIKHLQNIKDADDEWDVTVKANKAILALNHHGRGPVHINLSTRYSNNFLVKELPQAHKIERITLCDEIPKINQS